jgi:hypothetical protein
VGAGMVTTIVFGALNTLGLTQIDYDYIIYPAGLASIVALVSVSLLTPPSPEHKWKPFRAE